MEQEQTPANAYDTKELSFFPQLKAAASVTDPRSRLLSHISDQIARRATDPSGEVPVIRNASPEPDNPYQQGTRSKKGSQYVRVVRKPSFLDPDRNAAIDELLNPNCAISSKTS